MTVRSDLTPSSAIPLAYYAVAHAGLAGALLVLIVDPAQPGARFARAIFLLWTPGLPLLAAGLPSENQLAIRVAALRLFGGVSVGGAYILYMLRQSRLP